MSDSNPPCKIALVVDSTCDIPSETVKRYQLKVVPLYVIFGTQSYKDGVEIDEATFYDRLQHSKVHPATSQPSPEDFSAAYSEVFAAQQPDAIVCLTLSKKLSGTYNSAQKASVGFTSCPVHVIDTNSVSMGLGLVVMAVVDARERGASLAEMIRIAEQASEKVEVLFTLNTLEYLHRGGRIGGAQRLIGMALSIKPLLGIRGGVVVAIENVRTRKRAVARLLDLARCTSEEPGTLHVALMDAFAKEDADAIQAELEQTMHPVRLVRASLSPVVGVHGGPGTIGIAVLPVKALTLSEPLPTEEPLSQLTAQA